MSDSAPESESDPPPKKTSKSKTLCRLIGLVVFAAAVASVFLIDWKKVPEEEPPVVRPIKTMVIKDSFFAKGFTYPGKVSAGQQVNLAFEVPGTIVQKFVVKGDEVEEGELLLKLDDRDYENEYDSAVAEQDRAKAFFERVAKAAETGAASKQERDDAKAAFDQAVANVNIKDKALKDTELRARFSGRVGDIFIKEFQAVRAKQDVLSLHDSSTIEIDVSVPEGDVAMARPELREKSRIVAIFDFFPGEEFPVTLKEFATEADSATQTYTATVTMPRPEGKNLLPGMTATLVSHIPREALGNDAEGFPVPADAVPVDGLGQYYVWKLEETGQGTYTVHRIDVTVGEISGNDIVVQSGLAKNDRIALAGVHILQEGREVRLLDPNSKLGNPSGDSAQAGTESEKVAGQ